MNEKNVITKEYDYSNKVPMIEYITYLVNYCNDIFEKFKRNSNYNDESMDLIENNTKGILDKFPTVNCIFCTKEG